MELGIILLILAITIIAIWLIFEIKKSRHKVFAIFLILLILLSYFSFAIIFKNNDFNLTSIEGFIDASKLYFSWLGSIFGNVRTITSNAIKMDWTTTNNEGNKSIS